MSNLLCTIYESNATTGYVFGLINTAIFKYIYRCLIESNSDCIAINIEEVGLISIHIIIKINYFNTAFDLNSICDSIDE